MIRGLKLFLLLPLLLIAQVALAQAEAVTKPSTAYHLLFTDPFEDSDDLFAVYAFIGNMLDSQDQFRIITANEIKPRQAAGLRASALYQLLSEAADPKTSDLRPEQRQGLAKALAEGRLQIIQGSVYLPFQQAYEQFLLSGQGDPHFYAPSLLERFQQRGAQRPFKTLADLRAELLASQGGISVLTLANSSAFAELILGQTGALNQVFRGEGEPSVQIGQARDFYAGKEALVWAAYQKDPKAQALVKRIDHFWQMSGGINGQSEYNESLGPIAADFINRVFSNKNHGITPINLSRLLHPVGEAYKGTAAKPYPVDRLFEQVNSLKTAIKENLSGRERGQAQGGHYPGYFDKDKANRRLSSLNHDLLALVESDQAQAVSLFCHLDYDFDLLKNRVKRSYACQPALQKSESLTSTGFYLQVSRLTADLIANQSDEKRIARIANQQTDSQLADTFHVLFAPGFNRLGIFDFDCTITVDESFRFPLDNPAVIRDNTKEDIASILRKDGAIFAINSFIDSPTNILVYLESIFGVKPQLLAEEPVYLYNAKRQKQVLAFYLSKYRLGTMASPLYVTTLPKRTNTVDDPQTGEKNVAYHMAAEALAGTGKNIPNQAIIAHLLDEGSLSTEAVLRFFDDNQENVQYASGLKLLNRLVKAYWVKPKVKTFVAERYRGLPPSP